MESITVEIKPHHLRGNSYAHGHNGRMCPLREAMEEAGFEGEDLNVGANFVSIGNTCYKIPSSWNFFNVQNRIAQADNGSEESVTLILEKNYDLSH